MDVLITLGDKDWEDAQCEASIAESLATAANGAATGADGVERPLLTSGGEHPYVRLTLCFTHAASRKAFLKWTRETRDKALRCVDRALSRVRPALDVLQLSGPHSPEFADGNTDDSTADGEGDAGDAVTKHTRVVFRVVPTRAFCAQASQSTGNVPHTVMWGTQSVVSPRCTPAVFTVHSCKDTALSPSGSNSHDRSAADDDLWQRARASNSAHAAAAALPGWSSMDLAPDEMRKVRRLQLRLARWAADAFINEASWSRRRKRNSNSNSCSGGSSQQHTRRPTPGAAAAAPDLLSSAMMEPEFRSVLDAARAVRSNASFKSGGKGARVMHCDSRGMALEGVVIGTTALYAYLALPAAAAPPTASSGSHGGEEEAAEEERVRWALVARVPTTPRLDCSGDRPKRSRGDAEVDALLDNMDEALLHDDRRTFRLVPASQRRVTSFVAHRVVAYPRRATSSNKDDTTAASAVAVWFEDVSLSPPEQQQQQPQDGACEPQAEAPLAVAADEERRNVNTLSEALGVVSQSCQRYLSTAIELKELYQELRRPPKPPQTEEAPKPSVGEETKEEAINCSGGAASGATSVASGAECGSISSAQAGGSSVSAVAAPASAPSRVPTAPSLLHEYQLRLFKSVNALYASVTDTVSARFKKLRAKDDLPPTVRLYTDIAALSEGCQVEFKHHLAAPAASGASSKNGGGSSGPIMDVERIRLTVAAMASTRGGVILVGVGDDGSVVGHAPGAVVGQLRDTGFCPAMAKDAVTVREIRCPATTATATGTGTPLHMPAKWWLTGGPGDLSSPAKTATAAREEKVVTVISVAKGPAPFYAAGRHAIPYARLLASTTPMPVQVLVNRLLQSVAVV